MTRKEELEILEEATQLLQDYYDLRKQIKGVKKHVADMERINRHLAEDHPAQNNHDCYLISKAKMLAYQSMMLRLEKF
jgi:uncharacterized protein YlxW (UPF0749 family)